MMVESTSCKVGAASMICPARKEDRLKLQDMPALIWHETGTKPSEFIVMLRPLAREKFMLKAVNDEEDRSS